MVFNSGNDDDDDDLRYSKDDDENEYYEEDDDDGYSYDDDDDEALSKPSTGSGGRLGIQPFNKNNSGGSSSGSGGLPGAGASRFGSGSSGSSSPFSRPATGSSGSTPSSSGSSGSGSSSPFGASRLGSSPTPNNPSSPSGSSPSGASRFGSSPTGGGSGLSSSSGGSGSSPSGASRFGSSPTGGGSGSSSSSGGGGNSQGASRFGSSPSGGGSGSSGSSSSSGGSGNSQGASRFGSSPSGGGSGSSSSSGGGGNSQGASRFGSSPSGGGSGSSSSSGGGSSSSGSSSSSFGSGRFGAQNAPSGSSNNPPAKPPEKKDEKPASSGGLASRFGFGGGSKPDDKKDEKPASGGGLLGGVTSRLPFGGGAKPDDKKNDPKKDDKPASGGGLLSGMTARLPIGGAKPDAKKDEKPASGGGFASRLGFGGGAKPDEKKDEKPASGGGLLGGVTSRLPFGGGAKPEEKKPDARPNAPTSSASSSGSSLGGFNRSIPGGSPSSPTSSSSASSAGASGTTKPAISPFGAAKNASPSTDKKTSASASAPASGGLASRFSGLFRRGQEPAKPPARAKTSKAPTVATNEGLTLDNWLDIVGVACVFFALVLFFSAFSAQQAAIGGLLNFFGQLLGWGALAVPITLLVVGMWLIVRHFGETAPSIDPIRVIGIGLAFVALLVLFQYIDSLSYPANMPFGLLELRLQQSWDLQQAGGGAIGAAIYYFLIRNVTEIGGFFIVIFVFLIAGMLITRSSASDMLTRGVGVARNTRGSIQQRAIAQRAKRQLEMQQRALNAPPMPISASEVALASAIMATPQQVAVAEPDRSIRFNRGGETLGQPAPQVAMPFATATPVASVQPTLSAPIATPSAPSGGIFGRIRGNNPPSPAPTSAPNGNTNTGILGRFSRPNTSPEPMAPPIITPLPLDDAPMPAAISQPAFQSAPQPDQTPSIGDLMRPSPAPQPSAFSTTSSVSGGSAPQSAPSTLNPAPQAISSAFSPFERPSSASSTPSTFGAGTSTPSTSPLSRPTPVQGISKFPSAFEEDEADEDDDLRGLMDDDNDFEDGYDDEDAEDDFASVRPSSAPSTFSSPLADRTDRLNSLRSGNTGFPSAQPSPNVPTPAPSFTPSTPAPTPTPAPVAPSFGGRIETPAASTPLARPEEAFPTKQPSIFSDGAPFTPPSQLPSVQPNTQPSQQTLSIPLSSPVVNQTRANRPQWKMPDFRTLLSSGSEQEFDRELLLKQAKLIEDTLASFGSPGRVVEVNTGPVITQFGVEPDYVSARGKKQRVKVGAIAALDKDLQLALGARSIRVEAPVPGKGYVGVEVPNKEPATVRLRDVMESPSFLKHKSPLAIALGQSVSGAPISADLASMPHLLIAGTTGSGKSVCVNAIITSIVARNTPETVKFIMVDPKRVELTGYNGIPHLVAPVVVELERIVGVLKWVTREMDDRYKKFSDAGARNIEDYNKHRDPVAVEQMPYIVVIIDELADLMMLAPEETERTITRIAALARATGIHLVIATQRPSVDVVTGLIKANFPARIAFAVAGGVDSRVILDQPGAERLLGRGDMLYLSGDSPSALRLQGVYVSDMEIQNLVRYWKVQAVGQPESKPLTSLSPSVAVNEPVKEVMPRGERVKQQAFWDANVTANANALPSERSGETLSDEILTGDDGSEDEMYEQSVELVRRLDKASVSLLQRRLRIGYTRAARLIDVMEARGVIGPAKDGSSKPRDVIPQKP